MSKFNCRIMEAKYQYADVPFELWKTFNYARFTDRELALIERLELNIDKPYRLVHDEYTIPPQNYRYSFVIEPNKN